MNDVALEQAENDHREQRRREGCLEAARLVAEGTPRYQAMNQVRERMQMRELAVQSGHFVADADGGIETFLDSALSGNPLHFKNPRQIRAIALELFNSDFLGFEA